MLKYLFLTFLFLDINLSAYINIYPTIFDKPIDNKGSWEEYTLYNKTPNPIRYQISLSDFGIKNSMKEWTELYPRALTVKPGKSEKIRVYITAPKNTPSGEYFTTIEIKETLVPSLEKKPPKEGVKILTHLKMDIVGYVGNLNPKLKTKNLSISMNNQKLIVKGNLKNIGERRAKVTLILTTGKKRDDYKLGTLRVLKGEEVDVSKLSHEVKDKKILKKFKQYKKIILIEEDSNKKLLEINL